MPARASRATATPSNADFQPRVTPTARTMVSASTISTALARNPAVTSTREPVGAAVAVNTGRSSPRSSGLDELVELLERVDVENPVEDQELEHPEDPEGDQVGQQHDDRLVEVAEMVDLAEVLGGGRAEDRHEDPDGRQRPERDDLLGQVRAPALSPDPLPVE